MGNSRARHGSDRADLHFAAVIARREQASIRAFLPLPPFSLELLPARVEVEGNHRIMTSLENEKYRKERLPEAPSNVVPLQRTTLRDCLHTKFNGLHDNLHVRFAGVKSVTSLTAGGDSFWLLEEPLGLWKGDRREERTF